MNLYNAVLANDVGEVAMLLKNNPSIDVNWMKCYQDGITRSCLQLACTLGHRKIILLLLAHPGIDVNAEDDIEKTALGRACYHYNKSCVELLLKDPRVDTLKGRSRMTPFFWLVESHQLECIKYWIASGRKFELRGKGDNAQECISYAKKTGFFDLALLLENFTVNPIQKRDEIRKEIGWYDERAAEIFARVIFLSDGLLEIRTNSEEKTTRFFNITRQLPMELQMIICSRAAGSMKNNIKSEDSERAFRYLALFFVVKYRN